jgi:hypothetical protein
LLASSTFRNALEYVLMDVDSEQERKRMNGLARKVVVEDPRVRYNLRMFAANEYEKSQHAAQLQDDILEILIENEDDVDELVKILRGIANACLDRPDPLDLIMKIGRKINNSDLFHRILIEAAYSYDHFAPVLLKWLQSDARLEPYGVTQELINKTEGGVEVNNAIYQIVYGKRK